MSIEVVLFCLSVLGTFYAMVGYPLFLILYDRLFKPKEIRKDYSYEPKVTYMIVAHNEESCIRKKLENALNIDYPPDKLEILVTSDNSTDGTEQIVSDFINAHADRNIRLYRTKEHKGKTNAQNEAQKTIGSEIIVMSDANSMFKYSAIRELVAGFASSDVSYVCGHLICVNDESTLISDAESTYWDVDVHMRDIESKISTITAGIGSIYACRNADYFDFKPIECHDSAMPRFYKEHHKRAVCNLKAEAYEKAGENTHDEFKRKVRQNRGLVTLLIASIGYLNIFRYGWFSVFWFGHRTCRYSLWLFHLMAFVCTLQMACNGSLFGCIATALQIIWMFIIYRQMTTGIQNKLLRMTGYYGLAVLTQYVAIWRTITGKNKPIWDKAESTR